LSFFDEADETLTEPRAARPSGGGRRPAGGGPRPPASQQQTFLVRRVVAGAILLVVVILIAVGIHSCEVSQRNTALKNYATSVASLIQRSDQTGRTLFSDLSRGGGAVSLQNAVNQRHADATAELSQARGLSTPDEMKSAQQHLVLTLQMRADALANVGQQIQPALSKSGADAVTRIAAEMGRLYASDVIYKDYSSPEIAAALNAVGIVPNVAGGPPISGGQFVQDIQWLTPSFVASKLGASVQLPGGKPAPGIHGHRMVQCSAGGVTLVPGGSNTLPANPAPTFTCNLQNDGQNNETNVKVQVSVSGTSISGVATVPQTVPGQQYTVNVSLPSPPPTGPQTVIATIERVPGETVTTHNTLSFPVTFH
jgi:hypothetical protein